MITIKTPEEIKNLREGGKKLARILEAIASRVATGVSSEDLNKYAEELCESEGVTPAFLNYKPSRAMRKYPASLCVSINDEIVHGIPNERKKILKDGDIVSLDMGIIYKKMITDSAITVPVGKIEESAQNLIERTKNALYEGIKSAVGGGNVGDIGFAISEYIKPFGYGVVDELCGHGVGYKVHEDPLVPNFGQKGKGAVLKPGMVLALEPMINEGTKNIILDADGYTYRTADGKRSAHFEHTILITDGEPEILTKL